MIVWPVETLQNKYKRWYEHIVLTSQTRTLPDNTYFEKHHIIPQSIGGNNKKINLAILTAREHFICHRLLTRFLTGKAKMKMSFATWIMITNNNPHQKRYKVTSRIYEFVKKEMVAVQRTEEHRKKVSEGIKKSPNIKPPWNTGIPCSAEQKERLRQANLGKKIPPEQVAKMMATKEKNGTMRKTGTWKPSPEAIEKMLTTVAEKKAAGWLNPNIGRKASQETITKIKQLWTPERRKQASEAKVGRKPKPEHLENLRKAQATRRQRELEEKKRTAFVGPIKPDTAIEYRGVWYDNMNRAGKAHGISRGMIERQINAFGNNPPLEVCIAIDNNTIKWPRAPITDETKHKISQAQIGKVVSDETRKKQSEKALGRVPWNKGKTLKKHYLMIKKCMNTGLKYLCKTSGKKNPYLYTGSGVRWLNHIKKHKSHIITCIIGEYATKEELQEAGLYYSKLYNVVDDYTWANLTEEKGDGGLVGTGQLGKTWKIKDTSNMNKPKTKTDAWYEGKKKTAGRNNYQFKGQIKTPWGIFDTGLDAITEGKRLRDLGNIEVITDGNTLRKYLQSLDNVLNLQGRRTPKNWRGKTPRELGFEIIKDTNVKD